VAVKGFVTVVAKGFASPIVPPALKDFVTMMAQFLLELQN